MIDCPNHDELFMNHSFTVENTSKNGSQDYYLCKCGRTFGQMDHQKVHFMILWQIEHEKCEGNDRFGFK